MENNMSYSGGLLLSEKHWLVSFGLRSVSYTHLDVYKRQSIRLRAAAYCYYLLPHNMMPTL